ncbi:hypothetical protein HT136_03270 [Novosphingobium profundi]|uniref:hypothetical protein n=1 Tax=Novosphingobium profundi TaxID=1774954 RepID=UPI001BD9708D|nr:hypothetical protein [Novosphingobium profundi]MBT0667385.1 hypothetical protein [Novosphingobium profundi]
MNGLASTTPSPGAIRLTVSGFLLMLVQSTLLLLSPQLDRDSGVLIGILTPLALCAFTTALIGVPEPTASPGKQRHGM